MRVVQALHWLRDTMGDCSEDRKLTRRITKLLRDPNEGAKLHTDLTEGLLTLPTWMQTFLRPLLNEEMSTP
jgi:hypothetical protein